MLHTSNTSTPFSFKGIDPVLRLRDLISYTGLSKSTIYRLIGEGLFPKGFKIGLKARAWSLNEVNAWLESRKQGGV